MQEAARSPFYGTRGNRNARCLVVGESWGAEEAAHKCAFVGQSGRELDRILADAGIASNEVIFSNVRAEQPPDNEMSWFFHSNAEAKEWGLTAVRGLYPDVETLAELRRLEELISILQPTVIVGCGNYTLWALTEGSFRTASHAPRRGEPTRRCPTGVTSWRGSQLTTRTIAGKQYPFVPIIHPAAILRDWTWRTPTVHDLRARVRPLLEGRQWSITERRFIVRPSWADVMNTLAMLFTLPPTCVIAEDCETRAGHIACLGLSWSASDALCIPFMCTERDDGYWSDDEEWSIRQALRKLHERRDLVFVLQNASYDFQYYDLECIPLPSQVFDTMIAHHLLFPGTRKGLDYLSAMYCQHHIYWKDEGKTWDDDLPEEQLWNYNCLDAATTWECALVLREAIARSHMQTQFDERIANFRLAHEMNQRGCLIAREEMQQQRVAIMRQRMEREQYLAELMPADIARAIRGSSAKSPWYYSPQQQMNFFYRELAFPQRIKRKTGLPTIDDEALKRIEEAEPLMAPYTHTLRDLRSLSVYHDNILSMELDPDHRARSTYNVAGASNFRWSSKANAFGRGTNLMNIPKGVDKG